jgi:hypothetical protein
MIPATMLDHTATVWRSTESRSASLRSVSRSWSKVSGEDGVRLAVQTRRERREDVGPGETVGGEYSGYGPAGRDIEEGDVVQLTAGPEAPATLEVDSAHRPRNEHLELVLVNWEGSLS